MKKIIPHLLIIVSAIFIYSCTNIRPNHNDINTYEQSLNNTQIKNNDVKISTNREFTSWKSQLDFLKQGKSSDILKKNDLTLVSYKLQAKEYVGVFSGRYAQIDPYSNYSFIISNENNKENTLIKSLYKKRRDEFLFKFKDSNLQIVKLLWKYKNEYFYTDCVVSLNPSSIVYDDIISTLNFVKSLPPTYK